MIDPKAPNSDHILSRPTLVDAALQIGLVALLVYACGRIVSEKSLSQSH
jgi:hypothetical protein